MLQGYGARCNGRLAARRAQWQPGFYVSSSPLPGSDSAGSAPVTDIFREDVPAEFWMRCSRWIYGAVRRGAAT